MKAVSVVVTVKNEESTILQLLDSLQEQSLKPQEVIIIDGGSTDRTIDMIQSAIKSMESFKLIVAKGTNRGQGRNIGISAATSDIIALTDAGVILDKFWLRNLVEPIIQDSADFVGGVYVQTGESVLQKCIGILQYPELSKLRVEDFLPSCRSVAFRKQVWDAVGRWPEHLEKAEDTYFDLMVKEKRFRVALATKAIASWPARNSFAGLFSQYSSYAEWDAKGRLLSKLRIYKLMTLAYVFLVVSLAVISIFGLLGILFFSLTILAYLIYNAVNAFLETRRLSSLYLTVAIKITIFFAETYGIAKGVTSRIHGHFCVYEQNTQKKRTKVSDQKSSAIRPR